MHDCEFYWMSIISGEPIEYWPNDDGDVTFANKSRAVEDAVERECDIFYYKTIEDLASLLNYFVADKETFKLINK